MAKWEEIGRQVMNQTEDKVWFRIPYKNRVLINAYRFPTGSKYQADYRDRLLSSEAEDGGVWIDGVIKRSKATPKPKGKPFGWREMERLKASKSGPLKPNNTEVIE